MVIPVLHKYSLAAALRCSPRRSASLALSHFSLRAHRRSPPTSRQYRRWPLKSTVRSTRVTSCQLSSRILCASPRSSATHHRCRRRHRRWRSLLQPRQRRRRPLHRQQLLQLLQQHREKLREQCRGTTPSRVGCCTAVRATRCCLVAALCEASWRLSACSLCSVSPGSASRSFHPPQRRVFAACLSASMPRRQWRCGCFWRQLPCTASSSGSRPQRSSTTTGAAWNHRSPRRHCSSSSTRASIRTRLRPPPCVRPAMCSRSSVSLPSVR